MMPVSTIPERQVVIDDLHREIFPQPAPSLQHVNNHSGTSLLTDDEVHSKAGNAKNRTKYLALYNGELESYPTMSEGDSALACMYLFWTGGDVIQTERLLRASRRAQVDVKKRQQRADYWPRTIQSALGVVREFYKGESDDLPPVLVIVPDAAEQAANEEPLDPAQQRIRILEGQVRMLSLKLKALERSKLGQATGSCIAISEEIVRQVNRGKADLSGWCYIPAARIARRLKIGDGTVLRHAKLGHDAGVFERCTVPEWQEHRDPSTGELLGGSHRILKSYYRLGRDIPAQLEYIATCEPPPRNKWGGFHPKCPHCSGMNLKPKTFECEDCGHEVTHSELKAQKAAARRKNPHFHLGSVDLEEAS